MTFEILSNVIHYTANNNSLHFTNKRKHKEFCFRDVKITSCFSLTKLKTVINSLLHHFVQVSWRPQAKKIEKMWLLLSRLHHLLIFTFHSDPTPWLIWHSFLVARRVDVRIIIQPFWHDTNIIAAHYLVAKHTHNHWSLIALITWMYTHQKQKPHQKIKISKGER